MKDHTISYTEDDPRRSTNAMDTGPLYGRVSLVPTTSTVLDNVFLAHSNH